MTIREALTQSLNIPAVVVLDAVGPARLVARLKRAARHAGASRRDRARPRRSASAASASRSAISSRSMPRIARGGIAGDAARRRRRPAPRGRARPARRCSIRSRRLVRRRHPRRRAAAAQRLARPHRLQDRHLLRLSRRLGDRLRRQTMSSASGSAGPTARRSPAFPASAARRRSCSRPSTGSARAARRCQRPPAGDAGRLDRRAAAAAHAASATPTRTWSTRDAAPEIAFPRDGVDVDLGLAAGDPTPLMVKVRNGVPPFTFFANGAPFGRTPFARAEDLGARRPRLRHAVGGRTRPATLGPGDGVRRVAPVPTRGLALWPPPICHSGRSEAESRNPEKVEHPRVVAIALFCSGFRVAASPRPE